MNRRSGAQLRVLAPEGEVELAGALRKQDALRVGLQDAQGHQAGRDLLPLCVATSPDVSLPTAAREPPGGGGRKTLTGPVRHGHEDGYLLAGARKLATLAGSASWMVRATMSGGIGSVLTCPGSPNLRSMICSPA